MGEWVWLQNPGIEDILGPVYQSRLSVHYEKTCTIQLFPVILAWICQKIFIKLGLSGPWQHAVCILSNVYKSALGSFKRSRREASVHTSSSTDLPLTLESFLLWWLVNLKEKTMIRNGESSAHTQLSTRGPSYSIPNPTHSPPTRIELGHNPHITLSHH